LALIGKLLDHNMQLASKSDQTPEIEAGLRKFSQKAGNVPA
jgi:hypothetical protein